MLNVTLAPEALRRANSRAIADRDRWRRQYATLASAIRRTKSRMRLAHRFGNAQMERDELATLRALRVQADLMMLYRGDLAIELRDTAYRWVDLPAREIAA